MKARCAIIRAMADEDDVLAANAAFYAAFAARNIEAMEAVWARTVPVICVHPGWHALHGRDAVLASWRAILGGGGAPPISCVQPRVYLFGETALVVCTEEIPDAELVASNLFIREGSGWRLYHHHAGPAARAEDESPPDEGGLLH